MQEFVNTMIVEGLKTFCAMKMMLNIRSASFSMERKFYERVVVSVVTYGAEA